MTEIRFYRTTGYYGALSNFARYPFILDGVYWPTTEHYFQAHKFEDPAIFEMIRNLPTPGDAARTGRKRSLPLRKDWEQIKEDVMMSALRAKFIGYPELTQLLLNTGDAKLVEHTARDSYWGDGGNGRGLNRLGVLLMLLRNELRGHTE